MRSHMRICRSGIHRRWVMDDRQCVDARTCGSFPSICKSHCTWADGTSALCSFRQSVDGDFPDTCSRTRGLPRSQEEAKQTWKTEGRQSRGRRGESKSQETAESQTCSKSKGCLEPSRLRGGSRLKDATTVGATSQAETLPGLVSQNQLQEVKVPGAKVSTFSGRGILQPLLRHLRRSRCRLGAFARSFTNLPFSFKHVEGTGFSRSCFPMPLPYPEVLQEGSQDDSAAGCRKRGMNAAVIVLNFLFLGRPHRASSDMGAGNGSVESSGRS